MVLQMVLTSVFALVLALTVIMKGLPPIAYTIPARLAVFNGPASTFRGHAAQAEAMAGLRPL